ncbi:hypothetical protein AGMMS49592_0620 [Endomicrobiia bacterium]|nr:hypothetical protein AGMMS49592_0620 [Endomicrobiia bacterium]
MEKIKSFTNNGYGFDDVSRRMEMCGSCEHAVRATEDCLYKGRVFVKKNTLFFGRCKLKECDRK